MKRIYLVFIFAIFMSCGGKKVSVSMVTATSSEDNLPFSALQGKKWSAEKDSEFVKMHIYPDEPIQVSRILVTSCGGDFSSDISAFLNFDEISLALKSNGKNAEIVIEKPLTARSVTLNFNKNKNVCIENIRIFDEKKNRIQFQVPEVIEGSAKAAETKYPEESYTVMNLFDSRYENAFLSNSVSRGLVLQFEFKEKQKIEAIRIWNGYQRSDMHCVENGRLKSIEVTGDNSYKETIQVTDEMGGQSIQLPKAFHGNKIMITVKEVYKPKEGSNARGVAMSELRFYNGKNWFILNPMPRYKDIAERNKRLFEQAGFASLLNRSLKGVNLKEGNAEVESKRENEASPVQELPETAESVNWTVRLRTDGSMYMEGDTQKSFGDGSSNRRFQANGNFDILAAGKNELKLKVFGFFRNQVTEDYQGGDCNGCGRDCNKIYNPESGGTENIFSDVIQFQKSGKSMKLVSSDGSRYLGQANLAVDFE